MKAIIETGGKQYAVEEGTEIFVEKRATCRYLNINNNGIDSTIVSLKRAKVEEIKQKQIILKEKSISVQPPCLSQR